MPNILKIREVNPKAVISILILSIFAITLFWVVNGTIYSGYFIWDDKQFLFDEIIVKGSLLSVFFESHYGLFHPVTSLFLHFTYRLFGNEAEYLHGILLLFHIANGFLFFSLLKRLNFEYFFAAFFAIIYLFHPALIENYVWITNIKDLIATFFMLFASLFYFGNRHLITFGINKYYIFYNILIILSLMSKPTNVYLPFAFLIIDLVLNRKFDFKILYRQIFAISLSIGLIILSIFIRDNSSTIFMLPQYNISERIAFSLNNWLIYTYNVFIPTYQSIFYPYPFKPGSMPVRYFILYLIPLFIAILAINRQQRKVVLITLIAFVIIVPVLQFIPVGESARNDRYMNAYLIFILTISGFGIQRLILYKNKPLKFLALFLLIIFGSGIFLNFFKRISVWSSIEKVLITDYNKFPECNILANTLGVYYLNSGLIDQAIVYFNKAIETDNQYVKAFNNLGKAYLIKGESDKAELLYKHSIALMPVQYDPYKNLAIIFYKRGLFEQADSVLKVRFSEFDDEALNIFGKISYQKGQVPESISFHLKALSINKKPEYLYDLAVSYGKAGSFEMALNVINECIIMKKSFADAYFLRGLILYNLGKDPCEDLLRSEQLGFSGARNAIDEYCEKY
jgi:tetratricopeptide (TPR) repeat protein